MMAWQKKEMDEVHKAVSEPRYVTVYYANHEWTSPDNKFKRWKLIVETTAGLEWVYTYSPGLAELGTHTVDFYKDTSMRKCLRQPKKG